MAEDFMTEFRNPRYNHAQGIDCEICLPGIGWVPTTASLDDPETKALYSEISAVGDIANNEHDKDILIFKIKKRVIGYGALITSPFIGTWQNLEFLRHIWSMLDEEKASKEILFSMAVYDFATSEINKIDKMSYQDLTSYALDEHDWPTLGVIGS